jgi:hypothetical protein
MWLAVLNAVCIEITVPWDVVAYTGSTVDRHHIFGGICCLHLQDTLVYDDVVGWFDIP